MYKSLLSIAALTFAVSLSAQSVNTTYYIGNVEVQGRRVTVIPGIPDRIVFSSSVSVGGVIALPDRFMLARTDPAGNFMAGSLQTHELDKHHIITTRDNGVLVAGYVNGLTNGFSQLAVMKFDASLNLVWSKRIAINARFNPLTGNNPYERENIGIEKIAGQGENEDYYITFDQGNPNPSYSNEGVISVIKMNQNGGLVWHRMYPDFDRPIRTLAFLNDGVNDITAYPNPALPGTKLLCIAGTSFQLFGSGSTVNEIFFLSIDENGVIKHNYKHTNYSHREYAPDQVWDGNRQVLATVFEGFNAQYNVYEPFIIRLRPDLSIADVDPITFNPTYYKYINPCTLSSTPGCPQNWSVRAQSIALRNDGNYTVSCWETSGSLGRQRNAGFFKIYSANPNSVITPKLHNVFKDQIYLAQKHFTDANDYNYMVPTVYKPAPKTSSPSFYRPRLIKIDPTLYQEACSRDDADLHPKLVAGYLDDEYDQVVVTPVAENYVFEIKPTGATQDNCYTTITPAPPYYRLVQNSDEIIEGVKIFPSAIINNSQRVRCEFENTVEGSATVIVLNAIGQLIYEKRVPVAKGHNSFIIDKELPAGINLVKVSLNGSIATQKVVVQ